MSLKTGNVFLYCMSSFVNTFLADITEVELKKYSSILWDYLNRSVGFRNIQLSQKEIMIYSLGNNPAPDHIYKRNLPLWKYGSTAIKNLILDFSYHVLVNSKTGPGK